MPPRSFLRTALNALAAMTVAVILGSIAQTQFNLAALRDLGAAIDTSLRLTTTGQDLLGFAPLYAIIVVAVLMVALPLAGLLSRWLPRWRIAIFALAGFTGLIAALRCVIDPLVPMPTLIAASRSTFGLLTLALFVGTACALFAWLQQADQR